MRLKVLTAANMKMIVFWDTAPCSLVEIDRRFRDAYCLHHRPDDEGNKHLYEIHGAISQMTVIFISLVIDG
jgi:hypothetical protein